MNPTAPACTEVREQFSDYLDGGVSGREMQSIAAHLGSCSECKADFDSWRGMQRVLSAVGPVKAPTNLGLKLRLAISHENAKRQGHWWDPISVRWNNLLRPVVLQVSAGIAGAVLLVGTIGLLIGVVAAPQSVMANDEPLGALTSPHYLYSAAPQQPILTSEDTTIVVEAQVNAAGRVYDYAIVSGPQDASTDAQVRDQLMLVVYEPAMAFGQAVRGRILITFSGVSVRG